MPGRIDTRSLGANEALTHLGLRQKQATAADAALRWAARGRNLGGVQAKGSDWLTRLIGEPQRILHPKELLAEFASFNREREALKALKEGPGVLSRLKGLGSLTLGLGGKALVFGIPTYGVTKALTTIPAPGQTRGERIGRAIGEGLGWLPPMGILGTAASFLTPQYSLPGALGYVGSKVGRGTSMLLGEQPAEIVNSTIPTYY